MNRLALIWAFLVLASLASVVGGLALRRGPIRVYLVWYRNADLPAVIRNVPIVAPYVGAFVLPFALLATPFALGAWGPPTARSLQGFLVLGTAAWGVLAGGSGIALGSLLPLRLLPAWLREDDRRIGFAPMADWFDKATLVLGVLLLIFGLGLGAAAVWALVNL